MVMRTRVPTFFRFGYSISRAKKWVAGKSMNECWLYSVSGWAKQSVSYSGSRDPKARWP